MHLSQTRTKATTLTELDAAAGAGKPKRQKNNHPFFYLTTNHFFAAFSP
jgi:hypothetical protein